MAEQVDCVVIGAGVVGLACARALAMAGRDVLVLEAAEAIGTETSSRNSEVIHAGIYYPTGSEKARFCVAGRRALYDYCHAHGVPHARCGKLIVATAEAQVGALAALRRQAEANGLTGPDEALTHLSAAEVTALEPEIRCVEALLSPSTGIIDSHAFMLALQGEAEAHGAMVVFHAPVTGGTVGPAGGATLEVGGAEPMRLAARAVVNSAGLYAQAIARSLAGYPADRIPACHYAKGNYYTLAGRAPVRRLVYPLPEPGGLGVHVTIDLGGQARFGPDVEWVETLDYHVDPRRADRFYEAVRRYWPGLPDGALQPGYAGIRPKVTPAGAPAADFVLHGPDDIGIPGLVSLFGIESPGLTAALPLGEAVAARFPRASGAPR